MSNISRETVVATAYDIENHLGDGWEYLTGFDSQEAAEECLHRTGAYEGLPLMITDDNPRWRIVRRETVERTSVVLNVERVMTVSRFLDDLAAGGGTNMTEEEEN